MKMYVKDMDISTGGTKVALLNEHDAKKFDLHRQDRILIKKGKIETIAVLDVGESSKAVPVGSIGLFEETLDKLNVKHNDCVEFDLAKKPNSIKYIKKKLDGMQLSNQEINEIVADIVNGELDTIEITYFVSGCYTRGLNLHESINLTKAIVTHGQKLNLNKKNIFDKHCTGGVPGNRTTMVVVPIVAAAGLMIPKTSSRSISSPAGTGDTMEVLANVSIPVSKMKQIVEKANGCIVWGGAMNLAAADDKMIQVRHPLSIDPEGMLLASILAKKYAVGATHVLIDIPIGPDAKIKTRKAAMHLKRKFVEIGKKLGMMIKVIITDGRQPIGNGIGPSLEARDVLYVLMNDKRAPKDLRRKALKMASIMLNSGGIKNSHKVAEDILNTGKALSKMREIIKLQGGNEKILPDDIKIGQFSYLYKAPRSGILVDLDNREISRIARIAGAPNDKGAGIYLYKHEDQIIKKGEPIMTIYSESKTNLKFAINSLHKYGGVKIK